MVAHINLVMYDEHDNIIICKKRQDVDQGPISKKVSRKQKKMLNKSLAANKLKQEVEIKQSVKKQEYVSADGPYNKDLKKMIEQVKDINDHHSDSTIAKILSKNNYDMNEALNELMEIPEDSDHNLMMQFADQGKTAPKQSEQDPKHQANQIMNEFYDQFESDQVGINVSEFESLFEEIALIIKQDHKERGKGQFEIEEFIDSCMTVKDALLEGLEEVSIDQNDPLVFETQQFLEDHLKENCRFQEQRKRDFPTLGSIDTAANKNEKNLIQKIQDGYRQEKSKEGYFTPSKFPTQIAYTNKSYENSIYSINKSEHSYHDILELSKEYNGMELEKLKFIYSQLHDIKLCQMFMQKYYPNKKHVIKVEWQKKAPANNAQNLQQSVGTSRAFRKSIDSDYQDLSLKQIRDELDYLFKLKNTFQMTRNKTTNIAYRKQLARLACRDDSRIDKLREAAKYKLLQEMTENNPQYIDLHGYRREEIDDLFDSIRDMVKSEFRKGSSKIRTQKIGGAVFCMVKALTGKGLHSRSGKSVLKPALLEWSQDNGYSAKETEDSINIYIKVS